MQRTERMRELAQAILDGSARPAEVQALAQWVLEPQVPRALTDAELQALGALAVAEAHAMARDNAYRASRDEAPAWGEGVYGPAQHRLETELLRRGVL